MFSLAVTSAFRLLLRRAINGSFSIKSVLPALYPDDPALDYHNLKGVHNGSEAMDIFPKIKDMPPRMHRQRSIRSRWTEFNKNATDHQECGGLFHDTPKGNIMNISDDIDEGIVDSIIGNSNEPDAEEIEFPIHNQN